MKRWVLFAGVNIAIIVMISLILNLLGVRPYLTAAGIDYQSLIIFCLIWGMAGSFISLLISKKMAVWTMGVKIIDPKQSSGRDEMELVNMVHQLSKAAGLTSMPEVGIYPGKELNAFATGRSKNSSLVAVSSGLLRSMNRNEVEGVVGHEVAHIANGDMVTMTLIQGVVNAVVMFIARVAAFGVSHLLRSNSERGGMGSVAYMFTVILFQILFGILGSMITAWFSRQREFRADRGSAAIVGPDKMIAALARLGKIHDPEEPDRAPALASLKISGKSNRFMALLSTHPPIEKRIQALSAGR